MNEKIIDALRIITQGWKSSKTFDEILGALSKEITDEGSVTVAFTIFFERLISRQIEEESSEIAFRVLSEYETKRLGYDNHSYLLKLLNLGVITVYEMEMVLDQVISVPEDIDFTKEDINWMVLFALTEISDDILPGSRLALFSSDKIN